MRPSERCGKWLLSSRNLEKKPIEGSGFGERQLWDSYSFPTVSFEGGLA
jgi:hypothetical protein